MAEEATPTDHPKWGSIDVLIWKILPEKFGGGRQYIQKFKDAWVMHNKTIIKSQAKNFSFPAELLAGVCWIEVGGDPNFIDKVAFDVRSFDWSGPGWVDRNMTVTRMPSRTSFGSVSMQLRTAAETIGLDTNQMNYEQQLALADALSNDNFNIRVVALHLRQIINLDKLQTEPPKLSDDAIKIAGARYNRGIGLSVEQIRKNTTYGDFILKHRSRFQKLIY